jgi:hypothetical protein
LSVVSSCSSHASAHQRGIPAASLRDVDERLPHALTHRLEATDVDVRAFLEQAPDQGALRPDPVLHILAAGRVLLGLPREATSSSSATARVQALKALSGCFSPRQAAPADDEERPTGPLEYATGRRQTPVNAFAKERFCTLIAHGATVEHAMRILGYSMAVVYRHLHTDELFAAAYAEAQAMKRSRRGPELFVGTRLSADDSRRLLELAERHDNPVAAELRAAVGAHLRCQDTNLLPDAPTLS